MSAIQQMMAGRSPTLVTGSLSGSGSLSIQAGASQITLVGNGGAGSFYYINTTYNYTYSTTELTRIWYYGYFGPLYSVPKDSSTKVSADVGTYLYGGTYAPTAWNSVNLPNNDFGNGVDVRDVYVKGSVSYIGDLVSTWGSSTTATISGTTRTWLGGYGAVSGTSSTQYLTPNPGDSSMSYSVPAGGSLTYSYTY